MLDSFCPLRYLSSINDIEDSYVAAPQLGIVAGLPFLLKALERHCPYGTKRTVGVVTGKKADGSDEEQLEMLLEGVDGVSLFQ